MEKIFTCIKNIGVWHSFEKMKPQLCFFLKKPFLVISCSHGGHTCRRHTMDDGQHQGYGISTGELKIRAGGPLVIGVTPTQMPTAVKQYVDPHPKGGQHKYQEVGETTKK